jgi:hypothetical protein
MSLTPNSSPITAPAVGRGWFWLGVALALGAIGLEMLQLFVIRWLFTPWYLPVLGTIAVACLVYSFAMRRSIGRLVVLVFFGLLAAFEWWFLVAGSVTPEYTGPKKGEQFPAFEAYRADGKSFTQDDLAGPEDTVLVVFRGRW